MRNLGKATMCKARIADGRTGAAWSPDAWRSMQIADKRPIPISGAQEADKGTVTKPRTIQASKRSFPQDAALRRRPQH